MGRKISLSINSQQFLVILFANIVLLLSIIFFRNPFIPIIPLIYSGTTLWLLKRNKNKSWIKFPKLQQFEALELATQKEGIKKLHFKIVGGEIFILSLFSLIGILFVGEITLQNAFRILATLVTLGLNATRAIQLILIDFKNELNQFSEKVCHDREMNIETAIKCVRRKCNNLEQYEIIKLFQKTHMGEENPELTWDDVKNSVKSFPNKTTLIKAVEKGFTDFKTYNKAKIAQAATYEDYQRVRNGGFITVQQMEDALNKGFHTADMFQEAMQKGCTTIEEYRQVKKGGFLSYEEFKNAIDRGFQTKKDFESAQSMGAETNEQFMLLLKLGIPNMQTYQDILQKGFQIQNSNDYSEYLRVIGLGFETYSQFLEAKKKGCNDRTSFELMKKGGFPDCNTFHEAMKKGFNDFSTYQHASSKGFETFEEYERAKNNGVTDGKLWEIMTQKGFIDPVEYSKAIKNGFSNKKEYVTATNLGFDTKEEYERFLNSQYPDKTTWINGTAKGFQKFSDYLRANHRGAEDAHQLEVLQRRQTNRRHFISQELSQLQQLKKDIEKIEIEYRMVISKKIDHTEIDKNIERFLELLENLNKICISPDYAFFHELKREAQNVEKAKHELVQKISKNAASLQKEWQIISQIIKSEKKESFDLQTMFNDLETAKQALYKYLENYIEINNNTLVITDWIPTREHLKETEKRFNTIIEKMPNGNSISLHALIKKSFFKGSYEQFLNFFEEKIDGLHAMGTLDLENGIFTKFDEKTTYSIKDLRTEINKHLARIRKTNESMTIRELHQKLNINVSLKTVRETVEKEIQRNPNLDIFYPEGKISKVNRPKCVICKIPLGPEHEVWTHSECRNTFHKNCVIVQITNRRICPICKKTWILDEAVNNI